METSGVQADCHYRSAPVEFELTGSLAGTLLTISETGFEQVPARRENVRGPWRGWASQMAQGPEACATRTRADSAGPLQAVISVAEGRGRDSRHQTVVPVSVADRYSVVKSCSSG